MRKLLEAIAAIAVVALWGMTAYALYGPHPLTGRIPTHFNLSGQANGWGAPRMLWLLPFIATVIYGLMTLVARSPGSFNFAVGSTAAARPRLEAITLRMISWLKAEVACLFVLIQHATVRSAETGQNALGSLLMPLSLGAVFITIVAHFLELRAASQADG